jgi:hypothetical protein
VVTENKHAATQVPNEEKQSGIEMGFSSRWKMASES